MEIERRKEGTKQHLRVKAAKGERGRGEEGGSEDPNQQLTLNKLPTEFRRGNFCR